MTLLINALKTLKIKISLNKSTSGINLEQAYRNCRNNVFFLKRKVAVFNFSVTLHIDIA